VTAQVVDRGGKTKMSQTTAIPTSVKRSRGGASIVNELASDRFLIEIPMNAYARCLAKCDEKSAEYVLLRNGIVLRDHPQNAMVHIRCDADKTRLIRCIVAKECPEFLGEIHFYPDTA
jgi:hypothetical protein